MIVDLPQFYSYDINRMKFIDNEVYQDHHDDLPEIVLST